jgi:hypothetical protein
MTRSPFVKFHAVTLCLSVILTTSVALPPLARAADPTTADCLSASDASIQLRRQHKLRAAREQLLVCAAQSCPMDIRSECIRRVTEVNADMPTIVFEARDASGQDLSGVRVTIDGQPLVERLEGTALSIDPGEHVFTFDAPGQPTITRRFVIREGEKDRRELVSFGSPEGAPTARASAAAEPAHGLGTQRILAIASAGLGVAGVVVGTIFGVQSMSKHNDAAAVCPDQCSDQNGVNMWSDAQSAGNVSTIAFIVGGVGLVGGAVLWLTAEPGAADAPSAKVGIGPGTIQLKGAW